MKTKSQKPRNGFTLIELLVAMAITTVIITVLVSVTAMALDTWNRSRSEVRAARQAKAMIDTMAHDLESFVIRKGNPFEWLYAKSNPAAEGPNGNTSPNAIDLIFFTATTDRYDGKIGDFGDPSATPPVEGKDKGGDVSTVGYLLAYKDPIASATNDDFKTFVVYRKIVNPDVSFTSLLGKTNLNTAFGDVAATDGIAIDAKENFICENVYQFTITFHVDVTKSGSGVTTQVAVPVGKAATAGTAVEEFRMTGSGVETSFVPTGFTNDDLMAGRLTSVEISMSVITDFGLKQLRNRTFANPTAKAEFIAENTYQYSKLVQVPGS